MKEVVIAKGLKTQIRSIPIPSPLAKQVIIRVAVSGSNPKDWKIPELVPNHNANSGDDIAGVVHAVGSEVWEFKPGDRVASFHEMMTEGGSFAEYAVGWAHTTFHLPKDVSFEEASTIPLAAMTAAIGLHQRLHLPLPWSTAAPPPTPLVVYGGASAVGAYALKLAGHAGIHPLIAVAGKGAGYVETLIDRSKGDTIVDYRQGDEAVVSGIRDALGGKELWHAFDATSEHGSYTNLARVLQPTGKLTVVLPGKKYEGVPESVELSVTNVGASHKDEKDFAYVMFRLFARGLDEGWLKPHPHEVVPGGLGGVQEGLERLRDGKASAVKYVFRIGETEGLGE